MRDPYYDIPGISASGINTYLNRSPLHYWKGSPFNPDRTPTEETPALIFGRLAHSMILTPDRVDGEFAVAPDINRRTNAGKDEYAAFELANEDKAIIDAKDWKLAADMRYAMLADPVVRQLLGDGVSEEPVQWKREDSGLLCKAKLDYLRSGLVIDYKTTLSTRTDEFSRSIAKYGYHRQMSWYMDAAEWRYGERPRGAVIIAQNKDLPDDIGVFALDAEALDRGTIECQVAYDQICRRMETMDWRSHPAEIQTIGLPGWYTRSSS